MAKTPTEWKRDQRARDKAALEQHGGRQITFLAYGGTLAKLEAICEKEGFTGKQRIGEALTFLAENYET